MLKIRPQCNMTAKAMILVKCLRIMSRLVEGGGPILPWAFLAPGTLYFPQAEAPHIK